MINRLKNISLLILAAVAALGLAACSTVTEQPAPVVNVPSNQAEKQNLYTYLLSERGIDVIKMGETRTIVIASDLVFESGSANLNMEYAKNLKLVADLINTYDTTSVAVTVYNNTKGDIATALTEKQAQEVLKYLQKQGVDTRLIYAKGYGNLYPVTRDVSKEQWNRRIEIKFQFNPEDRIY